MKGSQKTYKGDGLPYFNYHSTAKKLIASGKLFGYFYTANYRGISPALVLLFDDSVRPAMPIRKHRWEEYAPLLPKEKELHPQGNSAQSFFEKIKEK